MLRVCSFEDVQNRKQQVLLETVVLIMICIEVKPEMASPEIDRAKLTTVVEDCLRKIPKSETDHLPKILLEKGQTRFFVLTTKEFLLISFLDDEEAKRISDLKEKGYFPFPGLIKPDQVQMSAAFRFEKTKYAYVKGCSVNNMFSFSVGKDSTITIQDHKQRMRTEELGEVTYTIKLAYLISFGDEITQSNIYDNLKGLMFESFKQWGVNIG